MWPVQTLTKQQAKYTTQKPEKPSQTEDPVMPTASPGRTKIPLSIPPILTAMRLAKTMFFEVFSLNVLY